MEAIAPTSQNALETVQSLESRYLFPTYSRVPLLLERGKGVFVQSADGRRFLDLITGIGVNALGHAHPRVLQVIKDQSRKIIHTSNVYYNEYQGRLAERLTRLAGMDRAFFTVSGAEAVEGAIKVARSHCQKISPDKIELVALEHSFHGRTCGALSITGQLKYRKPFGPLLPGVHFVNANDTAGLEAVVSERTCAIFIEPVQGEGGIFEMQPAYLEAAERLARQHGALLICDEIQAGLGRTGKMFAHQWTTVRPDIMVTAKPIACGYPLGAIMARGEAATALNAGSHGTTFGGGPLACRIALEFLDVLEEHKLLENVAAVGAEFKEGLLKLARRHACVKEVRGRGLMLGMELDQPAAPVFDKMLELGVIANVTHDTTIRFLPPYILESKHVAKALRVLAKALKVAGKKK